MILLQTRDFVETVKAANAACEDDLSREIDEMHLLTAIAQGSGAASRCLHEVGVARDHIPFCIDGDISTAPASAGDVLRLTMTKAQSLGHEHVDTTHMLLALLDAGSNISSAVLKSIGVDLHRLHQMVVANIPDSPFPVRCALERFAYDTEVQEYNRQIQDARLGIPPFEPRQDSTITAEMFYDFLEIHATHKLYSRLETLWLERQT